MARKSRGNVTASFNGNALTNYCTQADLAATIDQIETTHFGSTGAESITGDPEWSISLQGDWEPALDGFLAPEAVTPGTRRTAVISFAGASSTVSYTWTSLAEIQNWNVSSQVGGKITWSATLMLSGAPVRAAS
jgi:hypothetical protein